MKAAARGLHEFGVRPGISSPREAPFNPYDSLPALLRAPRP
jgi:hypothetical protein